MLETERITSDIFVPSFDTVLWVILTIVTLLSIGRVRSLRRNCGRIRRLAISLNVLQKEHYFVSAILPSALHPPGFLSSYYRRSKTDEIQNLLKTAVLIRSRSALKEGVINVFTSCRSSS